MEALETATHLHLLLNHVPTVGFVVGIGLFVIALVSDSDALKSMSLVVLVGIALMALPTYATGNAAERFLRETTPGFPQSLAYTHEGMAFVSLILIELAGAVAWLALWNHRRTGRLSNAGTALVFGTALAALVAVATTGYIGGQIGHPEIRGAEEITTVVGHLGRTVGAFVGGSPYGWPALETLHFIGLSLLVGVLLLIYLRMAGVMQDVSFAAVDRLLPWGMLGFALNTASGMLFFAAAADQYTRNYVLYAKFAFVVLAGANTLYFTFDRTWMQAAGTSAPGRSKALAASALVLWLGVLYWGNMLPFLGTAF